MCLSRTEWKRMSCESARPADVYQCAFCECQFEPGVADAGPDSEPRCPQCGLYASHRVAAEDVVDFVVTSRTKFR